MKKAATLGAEGKPKGGPEDQDGKPKDSAVLASCLSVINKGLKKAALTLGLTTKNKLSKPAVIQMKTVVQI